MGTSGSGPYWFGPTAPRMQNQIRTLMAPISGMPTQTTYQPELPRSCTRRIDTAKPGRNNANPMIALTGPYSLLGAIAASMRPVTMPKRNANRDQYQNSDRGARPLKPT